MFVKEEGCFLLKRQQMPVRPLFCLHLLSLSLSPRLSQFKAQDTEAKWKVTPGRLWHV